MQFFLQNHQKLLFFQIDTTIILFQWENKRKIKMFFNNKMCYSNFLPFLFIFQSKLFRIPFIFSLFLQKNNFCVFSKKRRNKWEKLLRNNLYFFPNSKMISKREKIKSKFFSLFNNTNLFSRLNNVLYPRNY